MPYKYETHLHTSESSLCGTSNAESMARMYKENGYTGIIVTDHFFNGNTTVSKELSWRERVLLFCKGFENAKRAGEEIGLDVFFGWEYTYKGADFLTYGLDKQWLIENPEVINWEIEKYFDEVHKSGGFISHAHPFRETWYINGFHLFPDSVDAVEVINRHNLSPEFDERALEYARVCNLLFTEGSDAHTAAETNLGGMYFKQRLTSVYDFINIIKSKKGYTLAGGVEL